MQIQLFGRPLFNETLLKRYLSEKKLEAIPQYNQRLQALKEWKRAVKQGYVEKETSVEQRFNGLIFEQVLGYSLHPSPQVSAWAKPPSKLTGISREPDLIMGSGLDTDEPDISAVVELKTPRTKLDMPQYRKDRKTPVEQAFSYGLDILGVRWVIATNMRYFRLYSVDWQDSYEDFDLFRCAEGGDEFKRFFYLLHHQYLVGSTDVTPTSRLLDQSLEKQLEIRDSFYQLYYEIRSDLLQATREATESFSPTPGDEEVLEATQRLLDRLIFVCFCEDAPDQLIPRGTLKKITEAGRTVPGNTVYGALKAFFRDVDEGSPPGRYIKVSGYNGELFKPHPIIDEISLPDSLHDKVYRIEGPDGTININGVWGIHAFDFWRQLNEHLLGHLFEESLSDAIELSRGSLAPLHEKLAERKRWGIYYTSKLISDFLTRSAVDALLDEQYRPKGADGENDIVEEAEQQIEDLSKLSIIDFACGSGAFLVSAFDALLREYLRLKNSIQKQEANGTLSLITQWETMAQSTLLRSTLYGVDLLPQAVEIAKLSLWLKSAHKGEAVANLEGNLVVADSLDISDALEKINADFGSFDVVVGNPPWGSEIEPEIKENVCQQLGLKADEEWDSWELFLVLSLQAVKKGGRIALVLPDTLFSPKKARIRRILLEETKVEKLHNLGPDWFGKNVRMGAVVLQARRGHAPSNSTFPGMILSGDMRSAAIDGTIPLRQLEVQRSRMIPQKRCLDAEGADIELFRSRKDDELLGYIEERSVRLKDLCQRGRGEEFSKAGLLWRCPSCLHLTTPGQKRKGGRYDSTTCPACGYEIKEEEATAEHLVVDSCPEGEDCVPYIDGDDISRRYANVAPRKYLRLIDGWDYKDPARYVSPKILIRQAGVGLMARLDKLGSYCPQSVYTYKIRDEYAEEGYRHEYLLGALLSRTVAYYVFKRYGEVEPARAHAKVTHAKLALLPIPMVNFQDDNQKYIHDEIVERVSALLQGESGLGGADDQAIESGLRQLWELPPEAGAYINTQFAELPEGQAVRDLFPMGPPSRKTVTAEELAI